MSGADTYFVLDGKWNCGKKIRVSYAVMVGLGNRRSGLFGSTHPSGIELKEAYINLRLIAIRILEHVASSFDVPILPLSPSGLLPKATQHIQPLVPDLSRQSRTSRGCLKCLLSVSV